MTFIIGSGVERQFLDLNNTYEFPIPQIEWPDGTSTPQYPCVVIAMPFAQGVFSGGTEDETTRYAFDTPASATSAMYDPAVGHPIAIPPDARFISVRCTCATGAEYAVQFGTVA
jgi:hypothetical protein